MTSSTKAKEIKALILVTPRLTTIRTSLIGLLAVMFLAGCNRGRNQSKGDSAALSEEIRTLKAERDKYDARLKELNRKLEASRTVTLEAKTWHAEKQTLRQEVEQPGYIWAEETTPIHAFYGAYVQELGSFKFKRPDGTEGERQVDKGDVVNVGALLARLKVPERENEVKLKKAMVEQARAELIQAKEILETASANVDVAKAMIDEEESTRPRILAKFKRWDSEYDRIEELAKKKIIDDQIRGETRQQREGARGEVGEVEARIRRAQAAYGESIAKKNKADADVKLAEQRIEVALANEKIAQSLFDYRDIVAPFKGVLTVRNVHTGHFVKPAQGGEKAEPLFIIVKMDLMRIVINVPELEAQHVHIGGKARIRIQALDNREIWGTITRTSWSRDVTARTLGVEVDVPNPGHELRPGMYAYGYIPIEYKDVWTLPDSAIVRREEEGTFVFRLGDREEDDGKAILTPVRLGVKVGPTVQVLKFQRPPVSPGAEPTWHDFSDKEQIIMNPSGFTAGMKIEKSVSAK